MLNTNAKDKEMRPLGQTGYRRPFPITNYNLVLHLLVDQAKAQKKWSYGFFVDFYTAFDTIPRELYFADFQKAFAYV